MKALSLLQPWASLVAIGAKQWETRSWSTEYRGPLAIHASARFGRELQDLCGTEPFHTHLAGAYRRNEAGQFYLDEWLGNVPLGAVLAVGVLTECWCTSRRADREHQGITWPMTLSGQERAFGDFSEGRYGWKIEQVRLLPEPIPAKGMLGLWNWESRPVVEAGPLGGLFAEVEG